MWTTLIIYYSNMLHQHVCAHNIDFLEKIIHFPPKIFKSIITSLKVPL